MADEMADSMNKLRLTSDEEEIIAISDDGRLEVLESCNLSLIGKFLTCKPFNKMAAKNTIWRAWGVDDVMQILEVSPNLFQFKFRSKFEMDRILRGGPWSFENQLLMLKRWKKGMTVGNIKMENVSLWVQIWGVPLDMISPQVAKQIGGRLGEVEEVEWKKKRDDVNFFMRVRVALPISKPLRRGGFIVGTDRERYWVDYKYKRLPIFCHYCGILGHDFKNCAAHYAVEKNGGVEEYQYGEFLRAIGGHSRGAASQSTGAKSSSIEGAGRDFMRPFELSGQGMRRTTAAQVAGPGNPNGTDKETSENLGNVATISVFEEAGHGNVTDVDSGLERDISSVLPPVQHIDDSHTGVEKDLVISNLEEEQADSQVDGLVLEKANLVDTTRPSISMPKTTWTRINRMDFGLGGLTKALTLPSLGKRDTRTDSSDQDEDL